MTVVVIQSRRVGGDFHMSEIPPTLASAALRASGTTTPTNEEMAHFSTLKQWCREHLQDPNAIGEPLHALAVSSIRWKDFNRWDSLMRMSNVQTNIGLLPSRIFLEACKAFGFALMKPL
jgi:hypothetical protein